MGNENVLELLVRCGVLGKQDVEAVRDLMVETGRSTDALAQEMGVLEVSQKDVAEATKEDAKVTEHSSEKKRELKEIISKLTADYPILGEAARMALNPMVLAVAGPIVAFEIWEKRVGSLTESLGGIALPDLERSIDQANRLFEKWNGIAEAIQKANQAFNSPEGVYKRTEDAIGKQLDSDKKLNDLNKEKALANLELQKGGMTDTAYKANQANIESFYANKENELDKKASEKRLRNKEQELEHADQDAIQLAKKAESFKLNPDPKAEEGNLDKMRAQAAALKKQAEDHRQEIAKINDVQTTASEGGIGQIRALPGTLAIASKYGYGFSEEGDKAIQDKAKADLEKLAKDAEDKAAALEREIFNREQLAKKRDQARDEAANAAGLRTTLFNEAPYFAEDRNREDRTREQLFTGRKQVNATKFVGDITGGGVDLLPAFQLMTSGLKENQDAMLAAIHRVIAVNKEHKQKIDALPGMMR